MPQYKFIVFPGNNSFVIKDALLKRGNWKEVAWDDPQLNYADIDFIWSPNSLPIKEIDKIFECQKRNAHRKLLLNHFEQHNSLTTKSDMIHAMNEYYRKCSEAVRSGYNTFHSMPASYVLTVGVNSIDSRDFMIKFNEIKKKNFKRCSLPEKQCTNNLWILKPENQSQGKGIEIFSDMKSIQNFLHYKPAFSKWVIQKYIERPLLYNGRKFDLRVWVLLTNAGEVLVYRDGYLRTSSTKYTTSALSESIHLTNWSLQKDLNSYEKHEQGNRLPLKEGLQQIFDQDYASHNVDYEKHIYPRMKDLIIDLVRSCENEIFNGKRLKNCFELFGFDFMIDEELRVWLIEANRNPGFGLPTEKAKNLIDSMVDEMLTVVVDSIFTPKIPSKMAANEQAKTFDLIYTMKPSQMNRYMPKNDRRSFVLSLYPIPELEPKPKHGSEKRFQVLSPLQEHEHLQLEEKKKQMDLEFIRSFRLLSISSALPSPQLSQSQEQKAETSSQSTPQIDSANSSLTSNIVQPHHRFNVSSPILDSQEISQLKENGETKTSLEILSLSSVSKSNVRLPSILPVRSGVQTNQSNLSLSLNQSLSKTKLIPLPSELLPVSLNLQLASKVSPLKEIRSLQNIKFNGLQEFRSGRSSYVATVATTTTSAVPVFSSRQIGLAYFKANKCKQFNQVNIPKKIGDENVIPQSTNSSVMMSQVPLT